MTRSQLMDLTVVSAGFPDQPVPEIDRENILDTLEEILTSGTEVVLLDGPERIGKTIVLRQFALRYPLNTISVFIRAASRWAGDPVGVQFDLCNQLEWALHGRQLGGHEDVDETTLRSLVYQLRGKARRTDKLFYFIVDGLYDAPDMLATTRTAILDMIPFGLKGFRFIITGPADDFLLV